MFSSSPSRRQPDIAVGILIYTEYAQCSRFHNNNLLLIDKQEHFYFNLSLSGLSKHVTLLHTLGSEPAKVCDK